MNNKDESSLRQEYLTKLALMAIFTIAFLVIVYFHSIGSIGPAGFQPGVLDYVLLGLAAFRLGRMVSFDLIAQPLRAPFTETLPDGSGAGESVEPKGKGVRRVIGEMISCPICSGTWISAILVYGLYAFPAPARIFLAIFSAAAAIELLNSVVEALSWSGHWNRNRTGELIQRNNRPTPEIEEWQSEKFRLPLKQREALLHTSIAARRRFHRRERRY